MSPTPCSSLPRTARNRQKGLQAKQKPRRDLGRRVGPAFPSPVPDAHASQANSFTHLRRYRCVQPCKCSRDRHMLTYYSADSTARLEVSGRTGTPRPDSSLRLSLHAPASIAINKPIRGAKHLPVNNGVTAYCMAQP